MYENVGVNSKMLRPCHVLLWRAAQLFGHCTLAAGWYMDQKLVCKVVRGAKSIVKKQLAGRRQVVRFFQPHIGLTSF